MSLPFSPDDLNVALVSPAISHLISKWRWIEPQLGAQRYRQRLATYMQVIACYREMPIFIPNTIKVSEMTADLTQSFHDGRTYLWPDDGYAG